MQSFCRNFNYWLKYNNKDIITYTIIIYYYYNIFVVKIVSYPHAPISIDGDRGQADTGVVISDIRLVFFKTYGQIFTYWLRLSDFDVQNHGKYSMQLYNKLFMVFELVLSLSPPDFQNSIWHKHKRKPKLEVIDLFSCSVLWF